MNSWLFIYNLVDYLDDNTLLNLSEVNKFYNYYINLNCIWKKRYNQKDYQEDRDRCEKGYWKNIYIKSRPIYINPETVIKLNDIYNKFDFDCIPKSCYLYILNNIEYYIINIDDNNMDITLSKIKRDDKGRYYRLKDIMDYTSYLTWNINYKRTIKIESYEKLIYISWPVRKEFKYL